MSKKQTPPPTPKTNWKAGLTLFGILALVLVVIVPLALLNSSDDRNRPPASDKRHIAAVFFPKNDGDRLTKGDWSFLETCNFKDCHLPVIIMDNTGQTYRYLINPANSRSLGISPNNRLATFVSENGELHTFFNGGMNVLPGMDHDFAGGVTAVRDDASVVAARPKHPLGANDPRLYATKDAQLYELNTTGMAGVAVACEGQLWRFESEGDIALNPPLPQREFAYDWDAQAFKPIDRPTPSSLHMPQDYTCLNDGKGSFAILETDAPGLENLQVWTWNKDKGFAKDSVRLQGAKDVSSSEPLSFGLDDQHAWVAMHNGRVVAFNRKTGEEAGRIELGELYDESEGFSHYRIAFAGDKAYVIGKSQADPERWLGLRVDLTAMAIEHQAHLPLLTENYLDRFPGQFVVTDPKVYNEWLEARPNP